jgi:hypothetical protein
LAPDWLASTNGQSIPRGDDLEQPEERVAILVPDDQPAGVGDDRERPAAEQHGGRDAFVDRGDDPGGGVAVAANEPPLHRRSARRLEVRLERVERPCRGELVVAPEEGERRGRSSPACPGSTKCVAGPGKTADLVGSDVGGATDVRLRGGRHGSGPSGAPRRSTCPGCRRAQPANRASIDSRRWLARLSAYATIRSSRDANAAQRR